MCQSVLNDYYFSIPSGTEDFSFKITRKNQYEEAIFKTEDDRYELDIIIECNYSVIKALEAELLLLAEKSPEEQMHQRISQPLGDVQCRSLSRVYGDHGPEVISLLNASPKCAIPIVLTRLRQKDVEWKKIRHDFKKTWREVYEKNFIKSLDHRSFYFKQDDKKKTSTKGLVNELREIHDSVFPNPLDRLKSYMSNVRPYAVSGSESAQATMYTDGHCMRFKMADLNLHNDVFVVLLAVCDAKMNGIAKQAVCL